MVSSLQNRFVVLAAFLVLIVALTALHGGHRRHRQKYHKPDEAFDPVHTKRVPRPPAGKKRHETFCQFQADAGLVCPYETRGDGFEIKPYQQCDAGVCKQAVDALVAEWGGELSDAYIRSMWPGADAMYVMSSDRQDGVAAPRFMGCVAVDRKHFVPFVSHLLVPPTERNKGHGKALLDFACRYVSDALGFDTARLWCKPDKLAFYERLGWTVEQRQGELYVMAKSLR